MFGQDGSAQWRNQDFVMEAGNTHTDSDFIYFPLAKGLVLGYVRYIDKYINQTQYIKINIKKQIHKKQNTNINITQSQDEPTSHFKFLFKNSSTLQKQFEIKYILSNALNGLKLLTALMSSGKQLQYLRHLKNGPFTKLASLYLGRKILVLTTERGPQRFVLLVFL